MEWRPQPKQLVFLSLSCYEALFGGAKGPGKTDSLLAESTRQLPIPGYQAIIFRRTLPKLAEIIERSHKWFSKASPKPAWNGEKHRWTWPNRNFIAFGYCKDEKDKYNYQGHEYGFMGFDQLEEFTETQYLFLIAQNRSPNPDIKCYVRATSNPGNIGHAWVKSRFIDKLPRDGKAKYFKRVQDEDIETTKEDPLALSRAFVFATVDDNPALIVNDPGYLRRLEMLPEIDKRALRWGDWDIFAGQFFKEWSQRTHVIPALPSNLLNNKFIGLDYGYGAPASVGWYACFPDGQVIRYKEFYSDGYSYEDLAHKIVELNGSDVIDYVVADPAIWGDTRHHLHNINNLKPGEVKGESGADVMQEIFGSKFPIIRADNSRIIGWGKVRLALKPYINQREETTAKFLVTENCLDLIRTLPGLIHDAVNPEDLDTSGEDHVADEIRYALMSRPTVPTLPPKQPTKEEDFWKRVHKDQARFKEGQAGEGSIKPVSIEGARTV